MWFSDILFSCAIGGFSTPDLLPVAAVGFDIFSFSLDFLLLHFLVYAIFIAGFLFGGRIFRINEDYEKSTRTTAQIQGIVMKIIRNR